MLTRFRIASVLLLLFISTGIFAQPDSSSNELENLLEDDLSKIPKREFINNAFKSSRVINGHSMEMIGKGVLDFRILHRFGQINGGFRELFGLDQASMRFGFDLGLTKNMTIGIGRSTFNKEVDGFFKYRIIHQHKKYKPIPFSLVWVSGMTMNTTKINDPALNLFTNRLGYYHQMILGRKFGEAFTLQLSPTFVHRNLVDLKTDKNDLLAVGVGARVKLTNRSALILDAYPIAYGARSNYNQWPISIGFDIETGGHVFQLHVSNTRGMNEKAFIGETTQRWDKGEIQIGFNLSRVFTVMRNDDTSW
jgi:hypothetical protein